MWTNVYTQHTVMTFTFTHAQTHTYILHTHTCTHTHTHTPCSPKWLFSSIVILAQIWQHIMSSLNGLGERLAAMNLPVSAVALIWTIVGEDNVIMLICKAAVSFALVYMYEPGAHELLVRRLRQCLIWLRSWMWSSISCVIGCSLKSLCCSCTCPGLH